MSHTITATKRLANFTLDVDITFPDSGLHTIVGPSGSGKTTLLRMIAGLETLDSGVVHCDGTAWSDERSGFHLNPWQRPVGMVFQDFSLFPHLSLMDNVLFSTTDTFWAESLMRALDVWVVRFAKPRHVSGGERQRGAICQALARKPRLLLLDEPFSALDRPSRRSLGALLRDTADKLAIPMILVTHDLEEALTLSDTVLTLVNGRISSDWLQKRIDEMQTDAARNHEAFTRKRAQWRV